MQLYLKNEVFTRNHLDIDTWQSTFKVNGQHSNQASWTNFAGIYKIEAPNPKLEINWRPKVHFCVTF